MVILLLLNIMKILFLVWKKCYIWSAVFWNHIFNSISSRQFKLYLALHYEMFCISLLIVDKSFHLICYCDKSVFRFMEGLTRIALRIIFNWVWSILIKKIPHVRNRELLPFKTRKWNLILNFFVRIDGVVLNGGQKVKLYRKSVLGNYLLEL